MCDSLEDGINWSAHFEAQCDLVGHDSDTEESEKSLLSRYTLRLGLYLDQSLNLEY